MAAGIVIGAALAAALIGTAVLYVRDRLKPVHDPSNDGADMDDTYLSTLCQRVGRGSSFHPAENNRG